MIDPCFLGLMPHTVTVEPWVAQDPYGQPVYGTPASHRARIEQANRLQIYQSGVSRESIMATTLVFMFTTIMYDVRSRVTLPDGDQPQILAVESIQDENGAYFTILRTYQPALRN